MLGKHEAIATVAVRDMNAAARFYEDTLGFKRIGAEESEALTYDAGASKLIVYRSQFAGTNQATSVTWPVGDDLESIVKSLRDKGVKFEHYDMPDIKREGDIHVGGNTRVAWFKDPDGNIHAIASSRNGS